MGKKKRLQIPSLTTLIVIVHPLFEFIVPQAEIQTPHLCNDYLLSVANCHSKNKQQLLI